MRLEILFQFIVPLTFLAIWALTSLLNRDAQPLPQRPPRPGVRPGPGQGQGPAVAQATNLGNAPPAARTEPPVAPRTASGRDVAPRPAGAPAPADKRTAGRLDDASVYIIDDEVVFVDPVTNRRILSAPIRNAAADAARGGPKSQRPVQGRKSGRGRRSQSAVREIRPEPETRRALSDQVGRSMSLSRGRPLDLTPLSSKLTPLSTATTSVAPARDLGLERSSGRPALQAGEVKNILGSPLRLRETIVLSEVLQPPVSLRRRLRSR